MPGMDLEAVPISDKRATYLRARLVCYPNDREAVAELIAAGLEFTTKEQQVDLVFRKSLRSGSGDNCVEIADTPDGGMAVRHSKHPDGPVLEFTAGERDAFIAGVKDGEFG